MDHKRSKEMPRNQSEGNRTAAREYNEARRRFVRSGEVDEKAREEAESREGQERRVLEKAGAIGRRHTAEEDPAIKKR